jgi:hypothetical protein
MIGYRCNCQCDCSKYNPNASVLNEAHQHSEGSQFLARKPSANNVDEISYYDDGEWIFVDSTPAPSL